MENDKIVKNTENQKKNTLGLVGFIVSIASIVTCGFSSLPGLVLSIVGLNESKKYNNDKKGLSIAGIVISSIMLIIFVIIMVFVPSEETDNQNTESSKVNNTEKAKDNKKSKTKIEVINFENMDKASIEKWCNEKGITCGIGEQYSDTVESGKLISQEPKAGTKITKVDAITIFMSKGREKTAEDLKNEYMASCSDYSYKDIARNPDNYKGSKAKFTGKVIQVSEGWFNKVVLRVDVTKGEYGIWDDTVYVNYKYSDGESKILEDDIITMYGTLDGRETYTSVLGAEITIPRFQAKYIIIN